MKTVLKTLLILIIAIIILAIALAAYIMIKNPLGLRDAFESSYAVTVTKSDINGEDNDAEPEQESGSDSYDHPFLNTEQEEMAAKFGIDVRKLPTEVSVEQKTCINNKLGSERVSEIIKGAEPSPLEMIKALSCF